MEDNFDTLVLSGGGIKGFCLLGGLQCAIDNGYLKNIDNYIGTSIGAIICYLIAIGYTPMEIIVSLHTNKWLEKIQYFNLVSMINGDGATSFASIHEALEKLTIDKIGKILTLKGLKELYNKNLVCVTYNMSDCKTEYLSYENYPDLPCITAVRMSANIPLVFDRYKYMNNYYVDGGISENFAILKGEEIGSRVFGLNLEISEKSLKDNIKDNILSYFIKLLQIPSLQYAKYKKTQITEKSFVINITTDNIKNAIDFSIKSKERLDLFSNGYLMVKKSLTYTCVPEVL